MTVTDASTPHERREQALDLVDAVIAAAFGDLAEAKRLLAQADRALPVSDEMHRAVLDASVDLYYMKSTDLYQELDARYQRVCSEFAAHLEGQITTCEETISAINDRIVRLERDNSEWK